ncbi:MAG: AMP-binding protein [Acidobacteriota bacterium]|nr:AMP-binding protein [Acidobacteriota bacterium]
MSKSFNRRFIESCERRPEKVAMRVVGDDSEIYTFGELLRQVRAVAYRLERENIRFGDKIALIGENHPCWEIAYLAALYRGAVCVPLDPHGEIETLTNFLENSEAKLAFLSADETEKFRQIEEKLGRPITAVAWRMENETNGFQSFEDWTKTEFPAEFAQKIPTASGDDAALLMYTSGTTGTPKGVPLTHENIIAELDGINEVLRLTENDKILSLLPLFHVYLQIVNLWTATTYGCEVGYLKELTPAELSEAMKNFKPTILTTVPRLWYLFHKKIFDAVETQPKPVQMIFRTMFAANGFLRNTFKINAGKKFFGKVHEGFGGNLRFAITAGSRFDEAVALDFHKLGFNILQGYGLTETSGAATATYEDDNRVGSVGKPFVNAQVKLNEPNAEGIGEVLIKGGMVFKGYYKNEEATRQTFTEDGWFRTGDLGKFDKDGHLYIVGRAKDVIVLPSGKNVHPEDLEVHYLKTPLVEEMAILGVKDETARHAGAEKLAAVIVPDFAYLKANNIANSREAIRHELDNLGRELPEYQRVRDYIIRIEPLPRTATRKIRRFELQKEIESGALSTRQARDPQQWKLSPEDENLLDSNAGRAVAAAIRKNAKDAETIHPAMNLEIDLGLDSLARAEVFASLEQAFGIEFDGDEAAKALTVTDAVELVRKHAGEAETSVDISAKLNWTKIVSETGTDLPEIRYVLKDRPIFSTFAWLVYKTFNLVFTPFTRLEVRGIENLRGMQRPFLVCPNHQSFLDPFVVCSLYPLDIFRHTFHVGASEFFQNALMRWLSRMLNVVPIDPDTQLMRAMKAGAAGLKGGKVLNIYPEGERAFDGRLHEFKKGAAILATELDLPILPVALDGLHKVWARASWRIRPAKVKLRFGKPFYARDIVSTEMTDDQKYEAVIKHLKETIASMIAEMRASNSE